MKRLFSLPAHKIIFRTCFIPSLTFVLLYEFVLTRFPSANKDIFKVGEFFLRISYSIVASSIFYFISQYIGIYIPKQQRKVKILPIVLRNTLTIDNIIGGLKLNLGMQWTDVKDFANFEKQLAQINTDAPVDNFNNWYEYLAFIKFQLMDLIRGITFYHEYLSKDFFHELLIIETRLTSPITFPGRKVLAISNLTYASLDLQELFIHNQHLQTLRRDEFDKNKKKFDEDGKIYREKFYNDKSSK